MGKGRGGSRGMVFSTFGFQKGGGVEGRSALHFLLNKYFHVILMQSFMYFVI